MLRVLLILLGFLLPVQAVRAESLSPDIWVQTVFDVTMAQALAQGCDGLGLDAQAVLQLQGAVLARIGDDHAQSVPVAQHQLDRQYLRFLARHDLTFASPDADFCRAGLQERALQTELGRMLAPG